MNELSRRSFFFRGLGALLATPAVAKVAALLPPLEAARVRSLNYLTPAQVTRESVEMFLQTNAFLENIGSQYDAALFKDAKVGSQLRIRLPPDYRLGA